MRAIHFLLLINLLPAPAAAATTFYVSTTGDGTDPTSGFATGWNGDAWSGASHPIDWSAVHSALATDDVYLYFKRGDTFGRMRLFYWDSAYHPYDGTRRLVLTVHPTDTGARPIFLKTSRTQWGLIVVGNAGYVTFDNLDLRSSFDSGDVDAGGISVNSPVHPWDSVARDALHFTNLSFANLSTGISDDFPGDYHLFENIECTRVANCIYLVNESTATTGRRAYVANVACHNINHDLQFVKTNGDPHDGHCVSLQSMDESIVENVQVTSSRTAFALWASRTISGQSLRRNVLRNITIANSLHIDYVNSGTDNSNSEGNLFYHNVLTNHPAQTASGYNRGAINLAYLQPQAGNGDRVFHNTVANSSGECFECWRNADHAVFRNNICDQAAGSSVQFVDLYNGNAAGSQIALDHNLYDDDRSAAWIDANGAAHDWAGWQGVAGHDTHGPTPADPAFTNRGTADWELADLSPAVDRGGWLSHATQAVDTSTAVTVQDPYWFHGNYGITNASGAPVSGMVVMFYDDAHGRRQREILDVDHATKTLHLDAAVTTIFAADHPDDPAHTTQLALPFDGDRPDIGRYEVFSAVVTDGGTPAGDLGADAGPADLGPRLDGAADAQRAGDARAGDGASQRGDEADGCACDTAGAGTPGALCLALLLFAGALGNAGRYRRLTERARRPPENRSARG